MKNRSMRPLSVIARTACDMYAWFMVAFGAYVIVHGDITPGGGFQGGAICATFLALMLVTQGSTYVSAWLNENFYKVCLFLGIKELALVNGILILEKELTITFDLWNLNFAFQ